jgi:hypothetical protein
MIKKYLHYAVAAALAAAGASSVAFAVEEMDNDSFDRPQELVIDNSGQVVVTGAIGLTALPTTPTERLGVADIDYYSFQGYAGNRVTIDIDHGYKGPAGTVDERSVDTIIAIWGPNLFEPMDDPTTGDAESLPIPNSDPVIWRDARLDQVLLPATGKYTIGVTSGGAVQGVPRMFMSDGTTTTDFMGGSASNGRYTLTISGVQAPVVQPPPPPSVLPIGIDIRPGVDRIARIDPKSRGVIPVALLSSDGFDARKVDSGSVRFGPTGKEATALRCTKRVDVNHDRSRDMVCIFDNQATRFEPSHEQGKITGTIAGKAFEGKGWLKVIPVKRKHHKDRHHSRDRDHDRDDD